MNAAFEKATRNRTYKKKVELIRAMIAESDEADANGDHELCSLLQASITAMANVTAREFGKGFYEVMNDAAAA